MGRAFLGWTTTAEEGLVMGRAFSGTTSTEGTAEEGPAEGPAGGGPGGGTAAGGAAAAAEEGRRFGTGGESTRRRFVGEGLRGRAGDDPHNSHYVVIHPSARGCCTAFSSPACHLRP